MISSSVTDVSTKTLVVNGDEASACEACEHDVTKVTLSCHELGRLLPSTKTIFMGGFKVPLTKLTASYHGRRRFLRSTKLIFLKTVNETLRNQTASGKKPGGFLRHHKTIVGGVIYDFAPSMKTTFGREMCDYGKNVTPSTKTMTNLTASYNEPGGFLPSTKTTFSVPTPFHHERIKFLKLGLIGSVALLLFRFSFFLFHLCKIRMRCQEVNMKTPKMKRLRFWLER